MTRSSDSGYSLVEILFVVGIIGVISAIAVPMMANSLGFFKLDGDARSLKNEVSTARMQAAANFSQTRLFLDYTTSGYHIETKANGAAAWAVQGGTTYLSSTTESYGFGVVATPPPNSQAAIAQAAPCQDNATPPNNIANSSCIVFNSRGIPVDNTGAPTGAFALYVTDGTNVYGVTISATSSIHLWKTKAAAAPAWVEQ